MFKQAVRHSPGQTKAAGTGDSGERYGGTVLCGISGT